MTHRITGELISRSIFWPHQHRPEPGDIVTIASTRYLITEYNRSEDIYSAEEEPRPMHGIVLWRATCSCGYSSSLGSKDKHRAFAAAYSHYVNQHVLPATADPCRAIGHTYGGEPYWHD
jgi:hypothetical protein